MLLTKVTPHLPRFSARHVTIANPAWTTHRHFPTFDEIDFEVKGLPLLAHDIVIPAVRLTNPSVDFERRVDGRNNWRFRAQSMKRSGWRLRLQDVHLNKGTVALADEQSKIELRAATARIPGIALIPPARRRNSGRSPMRCTQRASACCLTLCSSTRRKRANQGR